MVLLDGRAMASGNLPHSCMPTKHADQARAGKIMLLKQWSPKQPIQAIVHEPQRVTPARFSQPGREGISYPANKKPPHSLESWVFRCRMATVSYYTSMRPFSPAKRRNSSKRRPAPVRRHDAYASCAPKIGARLGL